MTEKQYEKFKRTLDDEIDEYKRDMCDNAPKYVYDRHYEIGAYEDIYGLLCCEAKHFSVKCFPEKNIIEHLYLRFMKTDYELCGQDLRDFLHEEAESYKSQNQM